MMFRLSWLAALLLAFEGKGEPPFPTGSHSQLVRKVEGFPTGEVRAVTVTREGKVLVAADRALIFMGNDRPEIQNGPAHVSALFAPVHGPGALAGGTNGVWSLAAGRWELEAGSPARVIAFAAEPGGVPWALAPDGVWRRTNSWTRVHTLDEDISEPHALLARGPDDVLLASESGLFGLMGKRRYWLALEVRPEGLLSPHARGLAWLDDGHFLVTTDKGLNISNGERGWQALTGEDGLPIVDLHQVVTASDGTVWFGSKEGLIRWKGGEWTYLASKRWLPDNRVTAIAPGAEGSVWVGTAKGLAHLHYRKLTLEEKAGILQKNIESRDRRHGYVTEMHLPAPGVVEGALQEVSDNDGLWTALYVAAQSFRYAVTKAPEARVQAWRSMQALLRLESLTGISGFPARAICHTNEPQYASRSIRSHPEWHPSPVEKGWHWKGETSSDEIAGHYFGWYVFYELADDAEQKQQVRATCKRVTDHILDHDYHLVDKDGQPTTWGVWGPAKLNDDPKWWHERGLGSLEMLSHLKVAAHLVAEPRYEQAYRELIQKHHYALNTLKAKVPGGVSHDDQLLFLAYYPLLQLEQDPGLRAIYAASIRRTWELERVEGNPLWNFIYGASTGAACDTAVAVAALREMPLDFILWKTQNSHRADIKAGRGIRAEPLPWTERVLHKWDKSPFTLDGGSDSVEGDPTIWLLPYWMGRYHRLIE